MTNQYINDKFTSDIRRLEDSLLGSTISHLNSKRYSCLERIFYYGKTSEDIELQEVYRASTPNYLKDNNFYINITNTDPITKEKESSRVSLSYDEAYIYNCINYEEFGYENWSNFLYHREEREFLDEYNTFMRELDVFLQSSKDIETKKFTIKHLKNRIKQCIIDLEEHKTKKNIDDTPFLDSKYQKALVNAFISNYNSYFESLTKEKYSVYFQKQPTKTDKIEIQGIQETVFGKNFDWIEKLHNSLIGKGFLNETSSLDDFYKHLYIDEVPSSKIELIGTNLSDIAYLIKSLKQFFKEDYENPMFFNEFWAKRFCFTTNDKNTQKVNKGKKDISKIISNLNNRPPQKKGSINEIIKILKHIHQ